MEVQNVKIWILVGVLAVVIAAFGKTIQVVSNVVTNVIITRLDDIISELKALNNTTAIHGQEIKSLQEQNTQTTHRLNDHADRLRKIEIKTGGGSDKK